MPQDKEYLLKEATAAVTYQPKLTAGRNINISENNVISSPDPPPPGSTVTVTPNQMSGNLIATVTVDSNSYNLYSPIPPVMTGATSEVRGEQGLVPAPSVGYQDYVLYGDGTWKDPEIPNIIANPAVSATTDLTKIYIDGTVYDVSGGGGSGSTVSITPTFADGVKIADYEIDGTSGILKIPVKELTQAEYDALPNTKLTDNVVYYISGAKVLDPDYTYHTWGENDEIVVRVYHEGQSDENIVWFFNGWNQTVVYETIPSSLTSYAPNYDTLILSANYPDGGTVQDGWIGFYQSTIRAWNQGKGQNVTGIKYGVVIVTNGAAEQLNPYEDDPYIWITTSNKKIILNGSEYANTGGGSGTEVIPNPQDQPTDTLTSIKINNVTYSIEGGGSGGEECYLDEGYIGKSGGSYVTCNLDKPMTNGLYCVIADDGGNKISQLFTWAGQTINVSLIGILQITETTAGLTSYSGNYRDITASIFKIGSASEIIPNPSGEPIDTLETIRIDGVIYDFSGSSETEKVTDIMLPQNNWYFKNESSMNVAWSNNEIVFTWNGGINIGASAQRSVVIPAEIDKIRFKITTGTSYYSTYSALERFKVAVGLRATYDTSWVYPDPAYTSDWLALTSFATPNDVWEGELDTSSIDVDTYLYIMGHGWNMTINEVKTVKIEKNIEPNPEETPTNTLETIGIDGTVYGLPGRDRSIPLFKEGQWLNQNIIEITPYLATIENNKLHCQGTHAGIVVSDILALSDAVNYSITIKVSSTNGFGFQIGQCTPTTNLDDIIRSGTNRKTYNNESSFNSGELTITTYNNTNGIFLGGYYLDANTDYYIEEISLLKTTVVKKNYT